MEGSRSKLIRSGRKPVPDISSSLKGGRENLRRQEVDVAVPRARKKEGGGVCEVKVVVTI